jgi:outer membrane protein assembly factor BamB
VDQPEAPKAKETTMKKSALATIVLTLAAAAAGAQMMGGGRGGHTPGAGTPGAGMGAGYGEMMSGMAGRGQMGPHNLLVTPKGTVIVTRALDANKDGIPELELLALTPAGTKAWTRPLAPIGFILGLSNDLLITVEHPPTIDLTNPAATTLVAIDAASGTEKWRVAIDGLPMDIEAFDGGTYVTVIARPVLTSVPTPGMRVPLGTTSLWAIGTGGNILWKYDLNS